MGFPSTTALALAAVAASAMTLPHEVFASSDDNTDTTDMSGSSSSSGHDDAYVDGDTSYSYDESYDDESYDDETELPPSTDMSGSSSSSSSPSSGFEDNSYSYDDNYDDDEELPSSSSSSSWDYPADEMIDTCGGDDVAVAVAVAVVPAFWLGDGICDPLLDCEDYDNDAGDCDGWVCEDCEAWDTPDCNGNHAPVAWIGDGICDYGAHPNDYGMWTAVDGTEFAVDFNCEQFDFDGQDCGADGTDTEDFIDGDVWGYAGNNNATTTLLMDVAEASDWQPIDLAILDCNENAAPIAWLADGYCDNGSYEYEGNLVDFNCEQFDFDGQDCGADGTEENAPDYTELWYSTACVDDFGCPFGQVCEEQASGDNECVGDLIDVDHWDNGDWNEFYESLDLTSDEGVTHYTDLMTTLVSEYAFDPEEDEDSAEEEEEEDWHAYSEVQCTDLPDLMMSLTMDDYCSWITDVAATDADTDAALVGFSNDCLFAFANNTALAGRTGPLGSLDSELFHPDAQYRRHARRASEEGVSAAYDTCIDALISKMVEAEIPGVVGMGTLSEEDGSVECYQMDVPAGPNVAVGGACNEFHYEIGADSGEQVSHKKGDHVKVVDAFMPWTATEMDDSLMTIDIDSAEIAASVGVGYDVEVDVYTSTDADRVPVVEVVVLTSTAGSDADFSIETHPSDGTDDSIVANCLGGGTMAWAVADVEVVIGYETSVAGEGEMTATSTIAHATSDEDDTTVYNELAGILDDELVTINVNGTESSIKFTDDDSAYRRLTNGGSSSATSSSSAAGITLTATLDAGKTVEITVGSKTVDYTNTCAEASTVSADDLSNAGCLTLRSSCDDSTWSLECDSDDDSALFSLPIVAGACAGTALIAAATVYTVYRKNKHGNAQQQQLAAATENPLQKV